MMRNTIVNSFLFGGKEEREGEKSKKKGDVSEDKIVKALFLSAWYLFRPWSTTDDLGTDINVHELPLRFTLSETSPDFLSVGFTSLLKTLWEKEKLLMTSNFSFPTAFPTHMENVLLFSSNLKLSSANPFNLEESKICRIYNIQK